MFWKLVHLPKDQNALQYPANFPSPCSVRGRVTRVKECWEMAAKAEGSVRSWCRHVWSIAGWRSGMTPPAASLSVGLPSLSARSGGVPQIPERSDLGQQHLSTAALPAAPLPPLAAPLPPPCSPSLTSSSPSDAEEEFILQALLRRRGRLLPPLNTMPGFKTIIKYLIQRIKKKRTN